jgi:NAD(P)-dependent dehydrogenase (short-subunit alcohol dehydrogenase family)
MTDSLWSEVEPFGIRVQCIEPGFFATSVLANAGTDAPADSAYAELHATVLRWYETSMAGAPPPDPVVEAIVAAADGTLPEDTIHHPIGVDAELFLGALSTMNYAEFRALGQQMLGLAAS